MALNNIERALALIQREFPDEFADNERVSVANRVASLMVRFAQQHCNAEVERRRAAELALSSYRHPKSGVLMAGFEEDETRG